MPLPYQEVPQPSIYPTNSGEDLPSVSGIYFVWSSAKVVYVGQAANLKSRANLTHERIMPDDVLSYVLSPKSELDFSEGYYIGVCRPIRNFGMRARVRTASAFVSDLDEKRKRMVEVLRDWRAKNGADWMPGWKINRRLRGWTPQDIVEVRTSLLERGEIELEEHQSGAGRPGASYRMCLMET